MVRVWGTGNWQYVAEFFSNRSDIQCQHRWEKFLSPELVKGSWTKEVRKLCIIIKNFLKYIFYVDLQILMINLAINR